MTTELYAGKNSKTAEILMPITIPNPIPPTGLPIPVRASFLVFKRLPLFGVATNNASPRLTLFADALEYRVISTLRRPHSEIELIDALQNFATQNIIFSWRRQFFAVSANVGDADTLRTLLSHFAGRQSPLTDRAHQIMNAS